MGKYSGTTSKTTSRKRHYSNWSRERRDKLIRLKKPEKNNSSKAFFRLSKGDYRDQHKKILYDIGDDRKIVRCKLSSKKSRVIASSFDGDTLIRPSPFHGIRGGVYVQQTAENRKKKKLRSTAYKKLLNDLQKSGLSSEEVSRGLLEEDKEIFEKKGVFEAANMLHHIVLVAEEHRKAGAMFLWKTTLSLFMKTKKNIFDYKLVARYFPFIKSAKDGRQAIVTMKQAIKLNFVQLIPKPFMELIEEMNTQASELLEVSDDAMNPDETEDDNLEMIGLGEELFLDEESDDEEHVEKGRMKSRSMQLEEHPQDETLAIMSDIQRHVRTLR